MSLAESSVTATARLIQEVLWVGMWKDLYCFALRINMVLPDWRGIIGLGLCHIQCGTGSDRFETRSTATHPERDIISRAAPQFVVYAEESVDHLCMVAVC